jgi:hypothetical protein
MIENFLVLMFTCNDNIVFVIENKRGYTNIDSISICPLSGQGLYIQLNK